MCNLCWATCILPPRVALILIEGDEGGGTGDANFVMWYAVKGMGGG